MRDYQAGDLVDLRVEVVETCGRPDGSRYLRVRSQFGVPPCAAIGTILPVNIDDVNLPQRAPG